MRSVRINTDNDTTSPKSEEEKTSDHASFSKAKKESQSLREERPKTKNKKSKKLSKNHLTNLKTCAIIIRQDKFWPVSQAAKTRPSQG